MGILNFNVSIINKFLDNNKHKDFEKLKISFDWQDRNYATYATTLFILKE